MKEHEELLNGEGEDDLPFPSEVGGYRSPSSLDKPFAAVTKAIQLTKRITPRAMRRSFHDLCRTAEVKDVVARSICGSARRRPAARTSGERRSVNGSALVGFCEEASGPWRGRMFERSSGLL